MLGRTGFSVSVLGLGTTKFGRDQGVKYATPARIPTDEQCAALLDRAAQRGLNLIDTAPAYGIAEERLGRLLAGRTEFLVFTKSGEEFEQGRSTFDFSFDATDRSVRRSRDRLGRDCLDAVLLHSDGEEESRPAAFADAARSLRTLREAGVVRAIGASIKTEAGAMAAALWADVLMVEFSLSRREMREAIVRVAERGVGVLVKKALASGRLASGNDPAAAFSFVLREPAVSTVLVGTTDLTHLDLNCDAAASAVREGPTA